MNRRGKGDGWVTDWHYRHGGVFRHYTGQYWFLAIGNMTGWTFVVWAAHDFWFLLSPGGICTYYHCGILAEYISVTCYCVLLMMMMMMRGSARLLCQTEQLPYAAGTIQSLFLVWDDRVIAMDDKYQEGNQLRMTSCGQTGWRILPSFSYTLPLPVRPCRAAGLYIQAYRSAAYCPHTCTHNHRSQSARRRTTARARRHGHILSNWRLPLLSPVTSGRAEL